MAEETIRLRGITYVVTQCIECGIPYTCPLNVWETQRANGGYHTCSNGHRQGWSKDRCENAQTRRERDKLRQETARLNDVIASERRLRKTAERSASAYKGQTTRLKKRAKAGVCPCCNRTFENLARHMATKHPDMDPNENVVEFEPPKKTARATEAGPSSNENVLP